MKNVLREAMKIAVFLVAAGTAYWFGKATEGTWFNLIFFRR